MELKKGTAAWRGAVAAAVGAVIIVVLVVATNGFNLPLLVLGAPLGAVYGFGYAFANWRYIIEKTKQGAAEGATVFGLGLLLSRLTRNESYGAWGWVYFLIRVAWNLGMGWIPGVWYGIQALRAEKKAAAAAPAPAQAKPPVRFSPQMEQEQREWNRQRLERLRADHAAQAAAQAARPAQTAQPSLACVAGAFAGASFPLRAGETVTLGSDPARCQIVLPGAGACHCALRYDPAGGWQAKGLPGAATYINGVQPLGAQAFQPLAPGTVLCLGQGKNSQRFRLE